MRHRPTDPFTRTTQAVGRGLLRAALAVFGLALMLFALVFGALLMLGLTVWALMRGRRAPPARFSWRGFPPPGGRAPGRPGAGTGEVVDIEAREVPTADR